jgi:hypothetical protein
LAGLPLERLTEQFTAQAMAELHDEFLDLAEGRAPSGAIGAVEVVQQVFRCGLEDRSQVRWDLYSLGLFCHLELLSVVAR